MPLTKNQKKERKTMKKLLMVVTAVFLMFSVAGFGLLGALSLDPYLPHGGFDDIPDGLKKRCLA